MSRSISHSGAWQVSAKTLIRDTDRSRLRFRDSCKRGAQTVKRGAWDEQVKRFGVRFGAVDRMNERFLAVRRKQQSSAHTSSLARVNSNLPLSYLPPTHPPLSRSLLARHSTPLTVSSVFLTLVRARARETVDRLRRLCPIAGTKASVNPCLARSHGITLSKQSA